MSEVRILHVDDEPDIREVVELSLGIDPDISVRSCDSGEAALSIASAWQPNIILLDVMMPAMDGPTTLARLHENPQTAKIPVVFMTARAQTREIDGFRSLGAVGVIVKPFDPIALAPSMRGYLQKTGRNLASLRKLFINRAHDDAASLEKFQAELLDEQPSPAAPARIKEIAHGLAGSGGIFDFPKISIDAGTLEDAVTAFIEGHGTIDGVTDAIVALLRCIKSMDSGEIAASARGDLQESLPHTGNV
jgi:two-component system OmpR family response regulator